MTHGRISAIVENSGIRFHPDYVKLFLKAHPENIVRALRDGSYRKSVEQRVRRLSLTELGAFEYLKMMVYSVDFRSEYTVTHTINTTAISVELSRRLGFALEERKKVFLGALLHDIGKIAISPEILEFQGRLTPEQMEIMKRHVVFTREIIGGLVDRDICEIAARHHEKLDGSGYPEGLKEAELTRAQQIVAVADIVSALTSKRSYKDPFPKEKTLDILSQMMQKGQLCIPACELMIENYDEIMAATDASRDGVICLYKKMHEEYAEMNGGVQRLLGHTVVL